LIKREPTLIVEVLSPSTSVYDLGDKFAYYRQIPALREIAFISIDARRTDVYRKGTDGLWVLHPFDAGASVQFTSVDLSITAAALFAEVDETSI
jgi:Uma2 family endonuclease